MTHGKGEGWLGWEDSNLRMQEPKSCDLPLVDTPISDISKSFSPTVIIVYGLENAK